MGAILLAAGLVAYNALMNRWPPFAGAAYLPANLLAGGVVVAVGVTAFGLDREALGLRADGIEHAVPFVLAAAALLGGALAWPRARAALRDRRLAGLGARAAAFTVLVRIPIGTALFEEVAFRGVLFAAFAGEGTTRAVVASSVAFGLWHLEPTRLLVRANRPDASRRTTALAVAGGVVATGVAGLFLAWLRARGGGIAAPWAVHAAVNALAAVAALVALRRG